MHVNVATLCRGQLLQHLIRRELLCRRLLLHWALAANEHSSNRGSALERRRPVEEGLALLDVHHEVSRRLEAVRLLLHKPLRLGAHGLVSERAVEHGGASHRELDALSRQLHAHVAAEAGTLREGYDNLQPLRILPPPTISSNRSSCELLGAFQRRRHEIFRAAS